jgi:hypothetical protein
MSMKRVSLPGADELFRRTEQPDEEPPDQVEQAEVDQESPNLQVAKETESASRPRHEEKVTFYCTGEELTRLERTRLSLRADHRLPSDRGKIVRAALEEVLEDFEKRGLDSTLVRRLQQSRQTPASS